MSDVPCILVVADSPSFGEMLVSHLARLNAVAAVAHDVVETVDLLERIRFDLVICDYDLQHGPGRDVVAFVEVRFPGMTVVLVSGDRDNAMPAERRNVVEYDRQSLIEGLPSLVAGARRAPERAAA